MQTIRDISKSKPSDRIIQTDKEHPTKFYSMKQLETQIFRYTDKRELTIQLIGDYLLSIRPWYKTSEPPSEWKWSGYLQQQGYEHGVMLRIPKKLFLEKILKPEEFFGKPIQSPLIHRTLSSVQSQKKYKNQNLFYLIEPNFK